MANKTHAILERLHGLSSMYNSDIVYEDQISEEEKSTFNKFDPQVKNKIKS